MKDIDATAGMYRATCCEWTVGAKVGFFYPKCGKKVVEGKAYCAEHLALAYQKPKKKRVRSE